MDLKRTYTNHKRQTALTAMALFSLSGSLFATAPTNGQLTVINGLGNVINGSLGASASSIKVVVNDASGACSTTTSVAYMGSVTVGWDSTKAHSATQCTGITSVAVTALKTLMAGQVQYDSTANSTPPATATAATLFTAPTTAISNLALIITGGTSAATTGSSTVWDSAVGVAPIYVVGNGALATTGIMGSVGSEGVKAAAIMRRFAVIPAM